MQDVPDSTHSPYSKCAPMRPDDPCLKSGAVSKVEALLASRVAQFNSYSCSAASAAIVINAIRRLAAVGAEPELLSQADILSRVDLHHWRERVSDEGYRGMHGMPLAEFGDVVREALRVCGLPCRRVDSIPIHADMADLQGAKKDLRHVLEITAASPRDFLVAHFTQGEYVGDWYGGHISPIGAIDTKGERVLIIDVDPECGGPYWVSYDRFFEGLVGRSKVIGVRGGGYVWVEAEDL